MCIQLSRPDIIVQPNAADVKKAVAHMALALVETGKQFVRWMDGTCLEAGPIPGMGSLTAHHHACVSSQSASMSRMEGMQPEQALCGVRAGASEEEEPYVHSFYLDACHSPELKKAMLGLMQGAQRVLLGLGCAAEAWKRHQALWKSNKRLALDRFQARPLHEASPPPQYSGLQASDAPSS